MKHPVSRLLPHCACAGSFTLSQLTCRRHCAGAKQELVRHIKDEPVSLDPAKAVGLPEIQVIRDLFEGPVNQNEKGS